MGTHYGYRPSGNGPYVNNTVVTDPQFNYVSLLLHGDGTNGAQNNMFLDSSSNAFSITRNGNTTQGSLSPYGNLWSNYFDGSGDFLQTPTATALNFNSVDYTVEAWVYLDMGTYSSFDSGGRGIVSDYLSNSYSRWLLSVNPSGKLEYYEQDASGANGVVIADTANMPLNQWVHTAICKSGTTMYLFKNGVLIGTATSPVRTNFGGRVNIGQFTIDSGYRGYFLGYISNTRTVKGTALYTSNFTPSTTPLTAVSGTSLLTCQSNRFIDNSANNFTITRNGDVRVTKEAPFLPTAAYSTGVIGGSGYFDGTGDYLTVAAATALDITSGDFTIEAWVLPGTQTNSVDSVFGYGFWTTMLYRNGSTWTWEVGNGSSSNYFTLSATCTQNVWQHIALTRAGNTYTFWLNGVAASTTTNTNGPATASRTLAIGVNSTASTTQCLTGYISNFRIVKGTAVYTAAFTPPTAPLTAITNTSLLLNFTNAGIFDNAAENVLETVGNAQISTSVKKYGTGSLAFDGNGDYLVVPAGQNLTFGSGDFTIEFWVYEAASQTANLYDQRSTGVQVTPVIYLNSNALTYYVNGNQQITGASLPTGQWNHVAVSRSGTSTKMFLNGTQTGSTYTDTNVYVSAPIGIGAYPVSGASPFSGYIDDLRITKGYARYTATFTPPTAAFPDQ